MKRISLNSILLFCLVIPFIMNYRLSWLETPFWLFGLIFLALLANISIDLLDFKEALYFKLKTIILWVVIVLSLGSGFLSAIIVRHETSPTYMIHDIILQQESAIRFLIHGKNPYTTSYFGTPLEKWNYSPNEINPALYHFVMEPLYVIFSIPFYFVSTKLFGFFDGRIPLLFLFLVLLFFAAKVPKENKNKLLFPMLLAFNPAYISYLMEGRSDIFMFTFLFAGFYFLYQKKNVLSGILFALSFAVKQSAWPLFPFYVAYLALKLKNVKKVIFALIPFAVTFAIFTGPFFLWGPHSFIESTVSYLSGTASHSYPISGYGLGMLLFQLGFIKDVHMYYPFIIWQIVLGIPLLLVLLKYLKKNTNIQTLIICYGIFLFVYWYISRYFNNSHLGYLSMVFLSAYFWPTENAA